MSRFSRGPAGSRASGAGRAKALAERARLAAKTLQAEYAAGKAGDDSAAEPIWGTPSEQLDALVAMLRRSRTTTEVDAPSPHRSEGNVGEQSTSTVTAVGQRWKASTDDASMLVDNPADAADDVADADAASLLADAAVDDADAAVDDADDDASLLAEALQRVDWDRVRATTSQRTGEAADAMRAMARQVDWTKVQPVAAQLSSALIAAVASGQLGVGGRMGPAVARAIINQGGLGQRVAVQVDASESARPPDFRGAIEASAREA